MISFYLLFLMACFSFFLNSPIGTQHTTNDDRLCNDLCSVLFNYFLSFKHPVGLYNLNLRYLTFTSPFSIRTAYK